MANHRSRTLKKYSGQHIPAFLEWPAYLFEKWMTPWRGNIMSVVSPGESWHVGNRITVPKLESRETDKAYHYLVELPGVRRDRIELSFKNGFIMLQVESSRRDREKDRYIRHSHSIRRALTLPVYTDAEAITAELKNGVLAIVIPKTDKPVAPQAKTIHVT